MILRSISKVYLLKLFQAKRAYILQQWLMLTRVLPPILHTEIDKHMEPLRVDKELAKLAGTVYDIRDYLYNGIHHKFKLKLYKKIRESHIVTDLNEEIQAYFKKRNDTLKPFIIEYNETLNSIDDDPISDTGDMLEGDDSNEEYGVY